MQQANMSKNLNDRPLNLPKLTNSTLNSTTTGSVSSNTSKLKIPSAYVPDEWVCNHGKKRTESADSVTRKSLKIKPTKLSPILVYGNDEWKCNHSNYKKSNFEILPKKTVNTKLRSISAKKTIIKDIEKENVIDTYKRSKSTDTLMISSYRNHLSYVYCRSSNYLYITKSGTLRNRFFEDMRRSPINLKYSKLKSININDNDNTNKIYLPITNSTPINPCDEACKNMSILMQKQKSLKFNRNTRSRKSSILKCASLKKSKKLGQLNQTFINSTNERKRKIALNTVLDISNNDSSNRQLFPVIGSTNILRKRLIQYKSISKSIIAQTIQNAMLKLTDMSVKCDNEISRENTLPISEVDKDGNDVCNFISMESLKSMANGNFKDDATSRSLTLKTASELLNDDMLSNNKSNITESRTTLIGSLFDKAIHETIKSEDLKVNETNQEPQVDKIEIDKQLVDESKDDKPIEIKQKSKISYAKKTKGTSKNSKVLLNEKQHKSSTPILSSKPSLTENDEKATFVASRSRDSSSIKKSNLIDQKDKNLNKKKYATEFKKNDDKNIVPLSKSAGISCEERKPECNLSKSVEIMPLRNDECQINRSIEVDVVKVPECDNKIVDANINNNVDPPLENLIKNDINEKLDEKISVTSDSVEIRKSLSSRLGTLSTGSLSNKSVNIVKPFVIINEITDSLEKKCFDGQTSSLNIDSKSPTIRKPSLKQSSVFFVNSSETSSNNNVELYERINNKTTVSDTVRKLFNQFMNILPRRTNQVNSKQDIKNKDDDIVECENYIEGSTTDKDAVLKQTSSSSPFSQKSGYDGQWIASGKTRYGLKIERLVKRYEQLSKQKKRLMWALLILIVLLLLSIIIAVALIFRGPQDHYIFLTTIPMNDTTSTIPTTIILRNGLVGDPCTISDNCGNYMECKQVNPTWPVLSCQCKSGYAAGMDRLCRGLFNTSCLNQTDCVDHSICSNNRCICKSGYYPRENGTCFGKYNSTCDVDDDCLKNGQCSMQADGQKRCECTTRVKSIFNPNYEYYRQCRLLIGATCTENEDCVENARCKKYCSCRDFDVYFETRSNSCEDGCKNKTEIFFPNGTAIKFPHPSKCGLYFTCSPRELDICTSNYGFNPVSQSCDSSVTCNT